MAMRLWRETALERNGCRGQQTHTMQWLSRTPNKDEGAAWWLEIQRQGARTPVTLGKACGEAEASPSALKHHQEALVLITPAAGFSFQHPPPDDAMAVRWRLRLQSASPRLGPCTYCIYIQATGTPPGRRPEQPDASRESPACLAACLRPLTRRLVGFCPASARPVFGPPCHGCVLRNGREVRSGVSRQLVGYLKVQLRTHATCLSCRAEIAWRRPVCVWGTKSANIKAVICQHPSALEAVSHLLSPSPRLHASLATIVVCNSSSTLLPSPSSPRRQRPTAGMTMLPNTKPPSTPQSPKQSRIAARSTPFAWQLEAMAQLQDAMLPCKRHIAAYTPHTHSMCICTTHATSHLQHVSSM